MIKAVLFDQDGVMIDTERDGHRIAFEKAFQEFGYDISWDVQLYHELLQTGGGKERIRHYFEHYYSGDIPSDLTKFTKELHERKTEIFLQMVSSMPLRPGIRRFMEELNSAHIPIGICTTSHVKVANTIAKQVLAGIKFELVLAGDMVAEKKPHPEIYQRALKHLNIKPTECLVIEDSNIGVRAAKAAGCYVLATYNDFTRHEDLSQADFIVSCLGDKDGEQAQFVKHSIDLSTPGVITFADLVNVF
ncbi:hypothetical protein BM613_09525 [Sulfoacidibacillus thermotolerans]|uniref:Phosphatase n=2 Tax=Sulfoacidibacillus thermotolerans TaxID=1765684 RepID=A0A2U3D7N6_SULT2|nr:hypothetical protein BM613_09525 [Sulfoacidibacillus thermotolerans]